MEKVVFGMQARSRISMSFSHFGFSSSHAIAGIFDIEINCDHELLDILQCCDLIRGEECSGA
jgi:hypothetical protein